MDLKECKCTSKQIEMLNKLNCYTCEDVITFYPFRYEIIEEKPYESWEKDERVCFEGTIATHVNTTRIAGKRTITRFSVETKDDFISITLFNRPWSSKLRVGDVVTIVGKYDGNGKVTAIQYYEKPISEVNKITPVYSIKEGMRQSSLTNVINKVFVNYVSEIDNFIPDSLIEKYRLINRKLALRCIHFPNSTDEIKAAIRTLKYEEFLKFYCSLEVIKSENQVVDLKFAKSFDRNRIDNCISGLPFELTEDQASTINDVLDDMNSSKIMYRLIQGDVGCGKTIVAAMAMFASVISGYQATIMAPTEILAKQHKETLDDIFKNEDIVVDIIYSAMSTKDKRNILERLKNNQIDILVGTHALIQESVEFNNLGLVVADEQHRFGVNQRKALKDKGEKVDFLLMSATPIPRTLANILYGDMDISTIKSMPKGRKPVLTYLIKENSIRSIMDEINEELHNDKQIYVICAAIEENEQFKVKNVNDIYRNLQEVFSDVKVEMLHGKMSTIDKEEIIGRFYSKETKILVSTTVVEVGVNVVDATMMIIYDASRFGLSQLHQLRGRIQRGSSQGKCYLLTNSKDEQTLKRLDVILKSSDGFEIAYEDLKQRGPGDLLGIRQSGLPSFILGDIFEDTKIIETAKSDAQAIFENQDIEENANLIKKIILEQDKVTQYMD